jgi:hypothetical protein
MSTRDKCIIPTISEIKKSDPPDKTILTHQWILESVGTYAGDGILTKMHCSDCGLRRIMILYDIKRTVERIKKKKKETSKKEETSSA